MESKIVLVEPGKEARITKMELTLENMQKTVGGLIQAIYPWEDSVALVCNDEGKILDMPPNRSLEDEAGKVYDIVFGTFFICGLTEDDFGGLTDELAEKYLDKFRYPQVFIQKTVELYLNGPCEDAAKMVDDILNRIITGDE